MDIYRVPKAIYENYFGVGNWDNLNNRHNNFWLLGEVFPYGLLNAKAEPLY